MKRSMSGRCAGMCDEMQNDLGIGGRLHDGAFAHQLATQP